MGRCALVMALLAGACGGSELPEGPALEPQGIEVISPSLSSLLSEGAAFELVGDEGAAQVAFALSGELATAPAAELPVAAGGFALWLWDDHTLELFDLGLTFDDIVVEPQQLLPDGLVLTGIQVSLGAAALDEPVWNEERTELSTTGTLDLTFDWAWHPVDEPEDIHPLGTQTVASLTLELTVGYDDAEGLTTVLSAERTGVVWSMANPLGDGDLLVMQDPSLAFLR